MSDDPEPDETADETSAGPADESAGEPVGSAAEEALRLVGAFTEWTRDHTHDLGLGTSGLAQQAAAMAKEMQDHLGGSEECRYCPFCRVLNAVRETEPEVRQNLSSAAANLMQAAADFLDPPQRGRDRAGGSPESGGTGPQQPGTPGMEHIDLDGPEDGT